MPSDHPIRISRSPERVRVLWRGRVVAQSDSALELREHTYPPVLYIPRGDADMKHFVRSALETTCLYKGVANYFSLVADDATDKDAVWTYESPLPVAADIKDHLAFYPNKVQITRG
ncbi:MAG: DUF427 domain-containing protein [Roseiarcus sp.]|jgi:uncharacterized protein (DUF427 family)